MSLHQIRSTSLLLLLAVVIAACGSAVAPSAAPSAAVETPAGPPETAPATAEAGEVTSSPAEATSSPAEGQTDTEWGRIWDRLPKGFPRYPDSTVSEEIATGPSSGIYVTPGAKPADIAVWFEAALEKASFATEALSGPMEDGGYVLASVGKRAGCQTQVSVAPLGDSDTISITILYGADCPKP